MFLTFILIVLVYIACSAIIFYAIGFVYYCIKEVVRAFKGKSSSSGYPSEIYHDLFF